MADYTQPAEAFEVGNAAAQAATDRARKNAAYGALVKTYGPIAGDPSTAAALQKMQEEQQSFPLEQEQRQIQNTAGNLTNTQTSGDQQRQAAFRAIGMLKASANPDGSIPADAYQKVVVPNAQLLGIDPTNVEQLGSMLTQPGGTTHLDALQQSLLGPTKVSGALTYGLDAAGNPIAISHDQYGRVIEQGLGGATPTAVANSQTQKFNAQTRAQQGLARLGIQQQNANTSAFNANVRAANQTYGPQSGPTAAGSGGVPITLPSGQPFDENAAAQFIQGAFPGATISSQQRSAAHNKAVGGVPDSEHLSGQAVDFVMPKGMTFDDVRSTLEQSGIPTSELINEGDHVHWGWGQKGGPAAPAAAAAPAATGTMFDRLPPKGRAAAVDQARHIVDQHTNLDNTNKILDQVQAQISPYTAGAGALVSSLPGTTQRDLKANLETLSSQGLTAWLNSLKNTQGQTGIGRVLQSEANAAMKIYGNMEQDQSAKQLAYHVQLFRKTINSLLDHSTSGFQQTYGVSPFKALGVAEPAPGGGQYTPQQQAAMKKYGL